MNLESYHLCQEKILNKILSFNIFILFKKKYIILSRIKSKVSFSNTWLKTSKESFNIFWKYTHVKAKEIGN